ncbi:MAG: hypothetical protein VBE63_22630 [Lamprobacter sp.]|uniref:hypothetical protein n=1 Tax=Lamprobacter sp. TaxID=3100796 RepID=UPI002B258EE4|nr:hypothetical protein [Lamprobacter sp.]MEA3642713.1 hypothetical protein [Lamprobacter sp.]
MMSLETAFLHLQQAASRQGCQVLLRALTEPVRRIGASACQLGALGLDDRLNDVTQHIEALRLSVEQQLFDGRFAEHLIALGRRCGELEFATVACECGVELHPLQSLREESRSRQKAPDFVHDNDPCLYFEVKTLARVHANQNVRALLAEAQAEQDNVRRQLAGGSKVATSLIVDQPYADKPYTKGAIGGLIETLILKTCSNYKPGQFSHGPTVLVLNLFDLPLYTTAPEQLRPVFWSPDPPVPGPMSGALWMSAFGAPGNLLFMPPEYAGQPAVEGAMRLHGVLQTHADVRGLIVLAHALSGPAQVMGLLLRSQRDTFMQDEGQSWETLSRLFGQYWNDEQDSNGWQLG